MLVKGWWSLVLSRIWNPHWRFHHLPYFRCQSRSRRQGDLNTNLGWMYQKYDWVNNCGTCRLGTPIRFIRLRPRQKLRVKKFFQTRIWVCSWSGRDSVIVWASFWSIVSWTGGHLHYERNHHCNKPLDKGIPFCEWKSVSKVLSLNWSSFFHGKFRKNKVFFSRFFYFFALNLTRDFCLFFSDMPVFSLQCSPSYDTAYFMCRNCHLQYVTNVQLPIFHAQLHSNFTH